MLLTFTQSLVALTKEVQGHKKTKNNNRQQKNNTEKLSSSWDGVPIWEKPGWCSKYFWIWGSGFHEGKTRKYKKGGHKDKATYANHMVGSTRRFKRGHYCKMEDIVVVCILNGRTTQHYYHHETKYSK